MSPEAAYLGADSACKEDVRSSRKTARPQACEQCRPFCSPKVDPLCKEGVVYSQGEFEISLPLLVSIGSNGS